MFLVSSESSFNAAHFLSDYHGKCENLHGHRWRVVAFLAQDKLEQGGSQKDMVFDFTDFKTVLRELTAQFDHSFIVEEGSLKQQTIDCLQEEGFHLVMLPFRTTAENLAQYFAEKLQSRGLPVSSVDVYETPHNCASYKL